ncbi:MAG: DUF4169 family protein, partial [Hyphomicrobiaceae bacterium]
LGSAYPVHLIASDHSPSLASALNEPHMPAEIINLRQAKKARARAAKEADAAANRAKFGRTKAERQVTQAEIAMDAKRLDSHKRDQNQTASKPTSNTDDADK